MRDLEDALREAAETGPPDVLDLGAVTQIGRRKVRRRRTLRLLVTSAAVTALIVAGPAVLTRIGEDRHDGVAPGEKEKIVGPVLRPVDASPATPGDYTVLTTMTDSGSHPTDGPLVEGATPDGLVVVRNHAREGPHQGQAGLLDPRTGELSWLPGTEMVASGVTLDVSDRWLVWQPVRAIGGGRAVLSVYDRRTEALRTVSIGDERLGDPGAMAMSDLRGGVLGPDDRVYFVVGTGTGAGGLWSVSLDDPQDLRNERIEVGDFDIDGDLLTYTDHTNRPVSTVHVLNLRSGERTSFDALSGSTCGGMGLDRAGDVIALRQYCGRSDGGYDERMRLISGSGEPILTVLGKGVVAGALTDDYASFMVRQGNGAGTYVYNLRSEELLRISDSAVREDPMLNGEGDVLTWATPIDGVQGAKLWVAEFD